MKLKKLFACVLALMIFSACASETKKENVTYSFDERQMFPFYVVDKEGVLWKIKRDGVLCLKDKVDYLLGGETRHFTKKTGEDTLIYATEIRIENGKTLCTVKEQSGDNLPTAIFENADFNSLKINNEGNILFIDNEENLYLRRRGTVSTVSKNVAQAEFIGDSQLVYRTDEISSEGGYPIYSYDGDKLTYLADGEMLLCSNDGNGYILKNIHNVQKRTGVLQVATCSKIVSGEAKFEIENVLISQFANDVCGNYLLCVDERQALMRFKVVFLNNQGENEGQIREITTNITAGKALAENIFFCEKNENGENYSAVIRNGKIERLSLPYNRDNTNMVNGKIVSLLENSVYNGETAEVISKTENVNTFLCGENYFMYAQENNAPYNLCIVPENADNTVFLSDVASLKIQINKERLFFMTGENGQLDLNMYDFSQKTVTAIISNVDENAGYVVGENTVAVVKKENGTMLLVGALKTVDSKIAVSRFV